MAIRKIARMGHPVLRVKARDLTKEEILSPAMGVLLEDMIATMNDYGGIGLAAPQIYESVSVAIVDYQEDHPRYADETKTAANASESNESLPFTIIINPKITVLDVTEESHWEGCLSVPGLRGSVARPKKIQVDYLDVQGKPKKIIAEGFLATVFQHEIDHLNGIIFIDRVKTEPGKTLLCFDDEYSRFHSPRDDDSEGDNGETEDLIE